MQLASRAVVEGMSLDGVTNDLAAFLAWGAVFVACFITLGLLCIRWQRGRPIKSGDALTLAQAIFVRERLGATDGNDAAIAFERMGDDEALGALMALARRRRKGLTLIEMLISVAVSMIVIAVVAQIFMLVTDKMHDSRAIIEMSGQLRNVTTRLQNDLDGMTASTLPWTKADAGDGYFEYIEGSGNDLNGGTTMQGDIDDILAFTARSNGKPFAVKHNGGVAESELAEIIWWVRGDTLCRRVYLIRPDLSGENISTSPETGKSNSLADLVLRQNRSHHNGIAFPHEMSAPADPDSHEVVLANVVAFDVKAWDPRAPVRDGTTSALVPGDLGWATSATQIGAGAYVDLGYANSQTLSLYSGVPNTNSKLTAPTYSTWPFFYEHDGRNQDGDGLTDEGTNGFDDGGSSTAADDPGEYETMPPYPHPVPGFKAAGLRGIQVRTRMHEPDSRQVRQSTVVSDFLPE